MKKKEKVSPSSLSARLNERACLFGVLAAFAGLGMMAYGIFRGEMTVVLEKAVRICMECIGIG